ncbi:septal ring lytic transglycosylase RlpA family protein [Lichenicoccus roseus]|uniref:RlpA-like protein double-psi beta-barrel domain-containing protein n=1 Tax=Lichenicoccus roseus TaxID=2683649 RepID=A0A5R9JBA0_9PROT|nr:RlpA-like double-psi beta-barrel domain-containing protein [Lichenicoccus roseus]TLU72666.1 hypothetical protein FE263_11565 [Lichenicoccus roseus]
MTRPASNRPSTFTGAPVLLLSLVTLSGCHHRQPVVSRPATYTVGPAWQGDGSWFYPAEVASYEATGIAAIDPAEGRRPGQHHRITADGEFYDASAIAGAHQTLQLPVVVQVENLENGHAILLRLNDRGPADPGRLLSVTPQAARLLGMDGLPRRVRVRLDEPATADLQRGVAGVPLPDATAAPVGAVAEQSLMPGSAAGPPAAVSPPAAAAARTATSSTPGPALGSLPDETADPGQLWIDAGHFSGRRYADQVAAATGGFVRQSGRGRATNYMVRIGPLASVQAADAALDHALAAGVTGARIVVE